MFAHKFQVQDDGSLFDKNVKTDVAVLGNSKVSLDLLLPLLEQNSHSEWHQRFEDLYEIEYEKVIKNDLYPTKEGLTMAEVLKEINIQSEGKAAIVSDVGQHQMIACRYADFNVSKLDKEPIAESFLPSHSSPASALTLYSTSEPSVRIDPSGIVNL